MGRSLSRPVISSASLTLRIEAKFLPVSITSEQKRIDLPRWLKQTKRFAQAYLNEVR